MRLNIVHKVFAELDSRGVRYCHWKSNEHLEAALQGDTDLDILFDVSQKSLIEEVLQKNNFHLFVAPWDRNYDGIVDYIGFDEVSAKIVHIHTHYKLMIGEVGVKSFHLPWEQIILDNTVVGENDFKIASPEIEYLLLIVRTALKFQRFNNASNKQIANHFQIEGEWLHKRVHPEDVIKLSDKYLTKDISQEIREIVLAPNFNLNSFIKLNEKLKSYLKGHRKLSRTKVMLIQTSHLSSKVKNKLSRILGKIPCIQKRRLPVQGVIVSLMGPDGAGKSTQTKEVVRELRKKVDVLFMYLGSGDGDKSFQRKSISKITSVGKSVFVSPKKESGNRNSEKHKTTDQKIFALSPDPFKRTIQLARLLSVAREKKNRLRRIEKARNNGVIVICDRYPQTAILTYNDGPKLQILNTSSSTLMRKLAQYEYNCYALANTISPDLVIKLTGDTKVLASRRPEMTLAEITKKQDGIKNIFYGDRTKHVTIDIDQDITAIKGRILSKISKSIKDNNRK